MPREISSFRVLAHWGSLQQLAIPKPTDQKIWKPRVLLAGNSEDIALGEGHLLACEPDVVVIGTTEKFR